MKMTWTVHSHSIRPSAGNESTTVTVGLSGRTGSVADFSAELRVPMEEARTTYAVGNQFTSELRPSADPIEDAL